MYTVDIHNAQVQWMEALHNLNSSLINRNWIVDDAYSLVDIAWGINIHRLNQVGIKFDQFREVKRWYRKIKKRPAFVEVTKSSECVSNHWVHSVNYLIRVLARWRVNKLAS